MNYARDGIEHFASVDVSPMAQWIMAIPFEDWPQQHRLEDGKIRPAMQTDLDWHGFRQQLSPIIEALGFRMSDIYQPMLSVVMPGHHIPPHVDEQADHWVHRVHVPIISNPNATMTIGDEGYILQIGEAYKIDTRRKHAINNYGDRPRIHLMFDVRDT